MLKDVLPEHLHKQANKQAFFTHLNALRSCFHDITEININILLTLPSLFVFGLRF